MLSPRLKKALDDLEGIAVNGFVERQALELAAALRLPARTLRRFLGQLEEAGELVRESGRGPGSVVGIRVAAKSRPVAASRGQVAAMGGEGVGLSVQTTAPKEETAAAAEPAEESRPSRGQVAATVVRHEHYHYAAPELLRALGLDPVSLVKIPSFKEGENGSAKAVPFDPVRPAAGDIGEKARPLATEAPGRNAHRDLKPGNVTAEEERCVQVRFREEVNAGRPLKNPARLRQLVVGDVRSDPETKRLLLSQADAFDKRQEEGAKEAVRMKASVSVVEKDAVFLREQLEKQRKERVRASGSILAERNGR